MEKYRKLAIGLFGYAAHHEATSGSGCDDSNRRRRQWDRLELR